MIKIKNYILNENELLGIVYIKEENKLELISKDKYSEFVENATFDDIEWNYGTPQETQRKMQKELCKSCYYRDTISNKLKELEEELDFEKNICSNQAQRILKAIEYIENTYEKEYHKPKEEIKNFNLKNCTYEPSLVVLGILKGEENE